MSSQIPSACRIRIGFMGETCETCGGDNFGGSMRCDKETILMGMWKHGGESEYKPYGELKREDAQ